MVTPKEVLISGERHLIIHGQFGNLQAKINKLDHMLKAADAEVFLPFLAEIEEELVYLKGIYPALDGGLVFTAVRPDPVSGETDSPKINLSLKMAKIESALRDMRLLMDVAHMNYVHEGSIDCHLKAMLDEAWDKAASEVGIDPAYGLPF